MIRVNIRIMTFVSIYQGCSLEEPLLMNVTTEVVCVFSFVTHVDTIHVYCSRVRPNIYKIEEENKIFWFIRLLILCAAK